MPDTILYTVVMAEASTGHIDRRDSELLDAHVTQGDSPLLIYPTGEYGWIVHVWGRHLDQGDGWEGAMKAAGFSPALVNLIQLAARQGAKWLELDCDAYDYDFLPTYDWDL